MNRSYCTKVLKENYAEAVKNPNSFFFVKNGETATARLADSAGVKTYQIFVGENNFINVEGPKTLLVGTEGTFNITDCDITETYVVTTLNGTVSYNEQVISYTPRTMDLPGGFIVNERFVPVILEEILAKLAWATDMSSPYETTYQENNSGEMVPYDLLLPYADLYFKVIGTENLSGYQILVEKKNIASDLDVVNEDNSLPNWTPVYNPVTGIGKIPCLNGTDRITQFTGTADSVVTIFLIKNNQKIGFLKVVIAADALESMYGDDAAVFVAWSPMQQIETMTTNTDIKLIFKVTDEEEYTSYYTDPYNLLSDEEILNGSGLAYYINRWVSNPMYSIYIKDPNNNNSNFPRSKLCTRFPFSLEDARSEGSDNFILEMTLEGFSSLRDENGNIPEDYISFMYDAISYKGLLKFNLPPQSPSTFGIVKLRPRVGNTVWNGLKVVFSNTQYYQFQYGLIEE